MSRTLPGITALVPDGGSSAAQALSERVPDHLSSSGQVSDVTDHLPAHQAATTPVAERAKGANLVVAQDSGEQQDVQPTASRTLPGITALVPDGGRSAAQALSERVPDHLSSSGQVSDVTDQLPVHQAATTPVAERAEGANLVAAQDSGHQENGGRMCTGASVHILFSGCTVHKYCVLYTVHVYCLCTAYSVCVPFQFCIKYTSQYTIIMYCVCTTLHERGVEQ